MFKLNLKIALRNLWKNKGITAINIGGLSVALAAFILVVLYFNYETGYDKTNPNYNEIYIVGRTLKDQKSNYTAAPFGKAIQKNIPEVVAVGTMKYSFFEIPVRKDDNATFLKKCLILDYNAAKMFALKPDDGILKKPEGASALFYLNAQHYQTLFPAKKKGGEELITLGSKSMGITEKVHNIIQSNPHSIIDFDAVSMFANIGDGEDYKGNSYYTYIQVKPETDVNALEQKINALFKKELLQSGENQQSEYYKTTTVFLDALKNQHLSPKAGNNANYKLLLALSVLGGAILIIACINFTNLSIAQAAKRAREVGVKKVMGAYRFQLAFQFLTEIFLQCLLGLILALTIAELILPRFNQVFDVTLNIWSGDSSLYWQLPLVLLVISLISGFYPALVLSGFKPALVLKGNFQTSKQTHWLRNGLLITQFVVAVVFIIGLLIINSQLKYMRTEDVGFKTDQVVYIRNMTIFSRVEKFKPLRDQMLKIPGVKSATVASALPDGSPTEKNNYNIDGKAYDMSFIDVDYDYFETLGIQIKEGRTFSRNFNVDTARSAILNETAVKRYGLTNPVGKKIKGCKNLEYTVVGVIKDFKSLGFEKAVEPTLYVMNNPCGNEMKRTSILLNIDQQSMGTALKALKKEWSGINKIDGDDFRYEFLDEMYGKLFKNQEKLQSVFFAAAMLTIFIAMLGLFAFAKFLTNSRVKEIAVRKILGASDLQIFKLINSSFFVIVIIANALAWPLAYVFTKRWLDTFAYRIDLPILPFIISIFATVFLTILTVSLQARNAVKASPVDALKYE